MSGSQCHRHVVDIEGVTFSVVFSRQGRDKSRLRPVALDKLGHGAWI